MCVGIVSSVACDFVLSHRGLMYTVLYVFQYITVYGICCDLETQLKILIISVRH